MELASLVAISGLKEIQCTHTHTHTLWHTCRSSSINWSRWDGLLRNSFWAPCKHSTTCHSVSLFKWKEHWVHLFLRFVGYIISTCVYIAMAVIWSSCPACHQGRSNLGRKCLRISVEHWLAPFLRCTWRETWLFWFGVAMNDCSSYNGLWLGGGFKHFSFSPLPGEMIQFDYYFSNGLKPPTRWVSIGIVKCQVQNHSTT